MVTSLIRVQLPTCSVRTTRPLRRCKAPISVLCLSQPRTAPQEPSSGYYRPDEPTYYPGFEEEEAMAMQAFHHAFENSKPKLLKVPGLQEFAAAIWDRRRRIPTSSDPLMQLFKEFDTDGDGTLNAEEIAKAFSSNGVRIKAEQVDNLIEEFEEGRDHTIKIAEWPDFVYSLAVSDLKAYKEMHNFGHFYDSDVY